MSELLDEWDFIGVYDDPEFAWSRGEYDDLVWPIMSALNTAAAQQVEAVRIRLSEEVLDRYDRALAPDDVREFARRVVQECSAAMDPPS